MLEIKQTCTPGTVIRFGSSKRTMINRFIEIVVANKFTEISIPILQFQETFKDKVGEENNNLMYNFSDRGSRNLCLAPEYTAVIQKLSKEYFKYKKDVKIFYVQQCFRGEKQQFGRWREFTQFGVEIINPTGYIGTKESEMPTIQYLRHIAEHLIKEITPNLIVRDNVPRGLDYYKEGIGFEIMCPELGTAQQVCGGGEYDGGAGFAIGVDRLMIIKEKDRLRDEQR